jgi:hypothetical protein
VGLLASCGSDKEPAVAPESTTTTAAPAPSTAAPAPTTAGAPACTPGGPTPTAPGKDVGTADVDGDRKPDTFTVDQRDSLSAPQTLRITTSQGVRSAIVLQPNITVEVLGIRELYGRPVVFVYAGTNTAHPSSVRLVVFHNCQLTAVHNAAGESYAFNVFRSEEMPVSGVGCPMIDGRLTLVGLSGRRTGSTVAWTRTIVNIEGDQARNGATSSGVYASPKDDNAIKLLQSVTCGDQPFNQS